MASPPETTPKSFLPYAESYELEGPFTLKAVLKDDNGERRESRLNFNDHITMNHHQNGVSMKWDACGGFLNKVHLHPDEPPHIRESEWGPMLCISYYYTDPVWKTTYGPSRERLNLGTHVTVKYGQLAESRYPLSEGVKQPPKDEPWRLYFEDREALDDFLDDDEFRMCFTRHGNGDGTTLQHFAAEFKYGYIDDLAREGSSRHTPFLIWLRSEFLSGRLAARKKLEEKLGGTLEQEDMADFLRMGFKGKVY